ncbi:MAG TPA: choice-of-anchor tandem repeat NxxGxxAF-containing protein [Devosia sp.]|jgi:hypothetical protein|nr:choice-of-anchor tandem repeat NxxGxxAF-containing protein [Devosia sp.]
MRMRGPRRRPIKESWPASSILGSAGSRLGIALAVIAVLWGGVLWVSLTPPREAPPPPAASEASSVAGKGRSPEPQPAAPVPQQVGLRALTVTGEAVGLKGSFDRFGLDLLTMVLATNNRGETAFYSTLRRSQAEEGMFLAQADGKIVPIAVTGDPVADQAGQLIAGFGDHPGPSMSDDGSVAFIATLGGGRGAAGVFLANGGSLRTIAATGTKAPVILGGIGVFAGFEAVSIDNSGDVAFLALVQHGRETVEAVYVARRVGAVHQLEKIAASGEPAPGGGFYIGFGSPVVNNQGAIAFPAVVKLGPAFGGIFVAPAGGSAHLLLGTGDPAPTGGIFARFSERIGFDDSGRVAFAAFINGSGPDFGIFVADGAERRAVAARGQAAPGGGRYESFGAWPAISHNGELAFVAATDRGQGFDGVFRMDATGKVTRVVTPGDTLMDGGKLNSLGLYPTVAIASDGAVGLLGIVTRDGEQLYAVLRYGLAPIHRP